MAITDLMHPHVSAFKRLVESLMKKYKISRERAERIARNQMADANVLPEGPGTADEG